MLSTTAFPIFLVSYVVVPGPSIMRLRESLGG